MKFSKYILYILMLFCFKVVANDSIYITRENADRYNVDVQVSASEIYKMYEVNVVVGSIPPISQCLKLSKVDVGFYDDNGPIAIVPLTLSDDGELSYTFTLRKENIPRTSIGINYIDNSNDNRCKLFSHNSFIVELLSWKTSKSDILNLKNI
jgi:hypothetical protein